MTNLALPPHYTTRRGNLLLATDAAVLVNPVNCAGVMGKGLAQSFAKSHPKLAAHYQLACRDGMLRPGHPVLHDLYPDAIPRYICSFPTKDHWRNPSRLSWISQGLSHLYRTMNELEILSVALPALGAGLGRLSWFQVESAIRHAAAAHPQIRTIVYLPHAPNPGDADPSRRQHRLG